ncbi:MAG: RluA family pseudouridine synthase [Campylobacteraceae bacterium]|nr:RluA family pseudouridine synthase [Campylobacteraceae bacterium]
MIRNEIKAWAFLVYEMGFSMKEAQKIIDKRQLFCNTEIVSRKSDIIKGEAALLIYEPNPKGLRPVYENEFFAVFEKPSGVLTHPRSRTTVYSLNDEIKYLYGKNSNVVHRLDKETSGLIIVSKSKEYEGELKKLFSQREIEKKYKALVRGRVENEMVISAPILVNGNFENVKMKVYINERGANAVTVIKPLKYFEDLDATLILAQPKTGRQHQIRVHMFHVEHSIIGDPIYGIDAKMTALYLDEKMDLELRLKLTRAQRLLLHADELSFEYKNKHYNFKSQIDVQSDFIRSVTK